MKPDTAKVERSLDVLQEKLSIYYQTALNKKTHKLAGLGEAADKLKSSLILTQTVIYISFLQ